MNHHLLHFLHCSIVTGVLVGVMGVARIVTSMGRTHLFFPVFGKINPRTQTPIYATLFVTIAAVPLCVLTDLPPLIDMVSAVSVRSYSSSFSGIYPGLL